MLYHQQKGQGVYYAAYVAIGQKQSSVAQVVKKLLERHYGVSDHRCSYCIEFNTLGSTSVLQM